MTYLQGRYRGFETLADRYPFWQYRHGDHCKGGHGVADGTLAAVGDPLWSRILPPHASYYDCRIVPVAHKTDTPDAGKPFTPPRQCPLYTHAKRDAPWEFISRVIEAHLAECRQAPAREEPDTATELTCDTTGSSA